MKKLKLVILSIVIISILFILTGCTSSEAETGEKGSIEKYENENFIVIYNNCEYKDKFFNRPSIVSVSIIIDKSTKVMYLDGRPMIDAEGKPLLYEGE